MAGSKRPARRGAAEADVDEFLRRLDHPLKPALEAVRSTILGAHPSIGEGIKWNSPSFHVDERYFATASIRKDAVMLILHLGAKVKDNSSSGMEVRDPRGLLRWLAKERAAVTFPDAAAVAANRAALAHIVRQWVAQLR